MTDIIISESVHAAMRAAQDKAASVFWKYPDADWQIQFQRQWLQAAGIAPSGSAKTVDGMIVGSAD